MKAVCQFSNLIQRGTDVRIRDCYLRDLGTLGSCSVEVCMDNAELVLRLRPPFLRQVRVKQDQAPDTAMACELHARNSHRSTVESPPSWTRSLAGRREP